jgi:predicted nuclease of restriction endonuclease-like (RecB) superfamily
MNERMDIVRMTDELLPTDYQMFLHSIKTRVQQAQFQAVLSVNKELILLYWYIGKEILIRQEKEGWGSNVIGRLSRDLHAAFPQMKGFSLRNLKYMRALAATYQDEAIVQQAVAQLPWGHNIILLEQVKDDQERLWYMQQTIEHGWSRNILEIQIESGLFQRKGKALTNFKSTLWYSTRYYALPTLKRK